MSEGPIQRLEIQGAFQRFLRSEIAGSIVLLVCTVVALVWANSPWAATYEHLIHQKVGVSWGKASFELSLQHWVNDALMAVFFFVVGLEIKREVVLGHLSSVRQSVLPVAAALGGMLVPALLYSAFTFGTDSIRGWGVPMATDIAFALGLLAVFGKRVPLGLKVFLAALAIADDMGAVLVIAVFYTERIRFGALLAAGVLLAVLLVVDRARKRRFGLTALFVVGVWVAVFASGVHATVAGILLALLVPVRSRIDPRRFIERTERDLAVLKEGELTPESMISNARQFSAFSDLARAASDARPTGLRFEKNLHAAQAFFILPLFAFFNAGVSLGGKAMETLGSPISLGIIVGLVLGKQIGVTLFSWLAVKLAGAGLPEGVTWGQLYGAACLAGVGFTMSLFISDLAFVSSETIEAAKIGILAASSIAGVSGLLVLFLTLPRREN